MLPLPVLPQNTWYRTLKKSVFVLVLILFFSSSLVTATGLQVQTQAPVNKTVATAETTPVKLSTTTAVPVQTAVKTTASVPVQTAVKTATTVLVFATATKTTTPVPVPTSAKGPLTFGTVSPTLLPAKTLTLQTARPTSQICMSGMAVCNGQCIDITSDEGNCGGCGNRCSAFNSTCYQGHCWGSCAGTQGPVNFNTDANNCGGCGQTCPAGQICYNWHCKDSIPAGWDTLCQYHDYYSSPAYTNLQADQYNCGRCGNWCGEHGSCIFGSCSYACTNPDGTIVHPNFYTDNQHCGQCGNACGAGSHCMEGVCMQNCPTSEYRRCPPGNSCMAIDVLNCHACGDACGENETCAYNPYSPLHYSCRCLPGYSTGTDGICVQFGTPEHCEGQSGTACPPGYKCLLTGSIFTGRCMPSCPTGYEDCGGTCKDPRTDPDNCGGCGNACQANQYCTDGTCYNSCPVGTRVCPEWSTRTCVDITTDPFNCGSCGNDCGTGKVCVNGVCQDGCPLLPGDGARCQVGGRLVCIDLRLDDPMHCGNCSNVCLANQWCEDGVCNTCSADEIYCASGCHNVRSRGACGGSCTNRCQNDQVCYNDECRSFCPQGYNHCYNGICANFQTDSNHCGQCGHVCTGETFCHAGQCVTECPQWTTRCGDKCVGLGIDKYNCGSCGHVCDHMCVLGICF